MKTNLVGSSMARSVSAAWVFKALATGIFAVGLFGATDLSQTPEEKAVIAKLGPDGFSGLPPLETLVEGSDAAVVGRIVGTQGITLLEADNPYSQKKSLFGYAGYRVAIEEVLFARNPSGVASLSPGTEMDLGMEVGRESAIRFVTRQIPVRSGDTCILFLFARPHGWTLLDWNAQFRRTAGPAASASAEYLGNTRFAPAVTPQWLGPTVTVVDTDRGAAAGWESLLAEVRRLGARPSRWRR